MRQSDPHPLQRRAHARRLCAACWNAASRPRPSTNTSAARSNSTSRASPGFQENEEVEEALGADGFGTVVHDALEMLLKAFEEENRPLTAADLPAVLPACRPR
ncbi:MAG: hypothetical protein WKG07_41155 [Hymenobacter sp.]